MADRNTLLNGLEKRLDRISNKEWYYTSMIGSAFAVTGGTFLAFLYYSVPRTDLDLTSLLLSEGFLMFATAYLLRDAIGFRKHIKGDQV